jgi:hypothetical protein
MTTRDSTELIRVSLPDLFNNLHFHRGNFLATLSISTCSFSLLIRPILKGRPRYLQGNCPYWTWNCLRVCGMSMPSHLMGKIWDFCMLVHRPVAIPNWWSKCCRLVTSTAIGLRKSIASSAYKLVRNFIRVAPIGVRRPCCVVMSNIFCKGSIANIKSMGESVSPCRRPRPCFMGLPGIPLSIIRDEMVLQISAIRSL